MQSSLELILVYVLYKLQYSYDKIARLLSTTERSGVSTCNQSYSGALEQF